MICDSLTSLLSHSYILLTVSVRHRMQQLANIKEVTADSVTAHA